MNLSGQKNLLLTVLAGLMAFASVVRADQIHLKDGRVVEAEEIGEVGTHVWYRQGKITTVVARTEVDRIVYTRSTPAQASRSSIIVSGSVSGSVSGATAIPAAAPEPVAAAPVRPHIMLRGGARIDADEIWESAERVRYRLGNIQGFIERTEIASLTSGKASDAPAPLLAPASSPAIRGRASTGHTGLDSLIARNAARHDVDPMLIYLVIREESGFNRQAVSRTGARGLMQLMPATARQYGVRNSYDPQSNIEAGVKHLKALLSRLDLPIALGAYNAGEGTIQRYGGLPPYPETQSYVRSILRRIGR